MNKETAEQIVDHMKAALELDPEHVVIKTTNANRMLYSIGGIQARIARGELPTLARIIAQHGPKESDDGTGSNT